MGWDAKGATSDIVHRWAQATATACGCLARELVAERPDVLVTTGDPGHNGPPERPPQTMPIITMSDDRDRGRARGQHGASRRQHHRGDASLHTELDGKRLEILHEMRAAAAAHRRAYRRTPPRVPAGRGVWTAPRTTSASNSFRYGVRNPREIRTRLRRDSDSRTSSAVNVSASPMLQHSANRKLMRRLDAAPPSRNLSVAGYCEPEGGLLGYGLDVSTLCYRQVASLRAAKSCMEREPRASFRSNRPPRINSC